VKYRDRGWFIYSRAIHGNLGLDHQVQTSKLKVQTVKILKNRSVSSCLVYSERWKTLKSSISGTPLPNKVAEWMHFGKSLAWIVTPKVGRFEANQIIDNDSDVLVSEEKRVVTCLCRTGSIPRRFEYSVYVKAHGPASVVLMEREITDAAVPSEEEELIYSEVMKTWLSPILTESWACQQWSEGVPLPAQVVMWLKQNVQRLDVLYLNNMCRTQYFKAPWSFVSRFLQSLVPKTIDIGAVGMELLHYTFSKPMLFVEALTHPSYTMATTPPNTGLVTLGRCLVKTMLTTSVIQRTGFPMHTTRFVEEDVETKEPSQTFAVCAAPADHFRWPRVPSANIPNQWLTDGLRSKDGMGNNAMLADSDGLLEWLNSCCNHVTYA
jgi:hypothetical protein